jgi:hypothetical protein
VVVRPTGVSVRRLSLRVVSLLVVSLGLLTGCTGAHSASTARSAPAVASSAASVRTSTTILHGEHPVPAGWKTWSSSNLTLRYPAQWHVTPFLGQPATVAFPLLHLSSAPLTGPCASSQASVQGRAGCFGATWPVAAGGILIGWTKTELPGQPPLKLAHGRHVTIDDRPAKVDSFMDGSGWEVTATIAADPQADDDAMLMSAQVGPRASQATLDDVFTMLATAAIHD